jgi:hypothetical protein
MAPAPRHSSTANRKPEDIRLKLSEALKAEASLARGLLQYPDIKPLESHRNIFQIHSFLSLAQLDTMQKTMLKRAGCQTLRGVRVSPQHKTLATLATFRTPKVANEPNVSKARRSI